MKKVVFATLTILAIAATAAFAQTDQKAREAAKAALEGVGQLADEVKKIKSQTPKPNGPTIVKQIGLSAKDMVELPSKNPTGWAAVIEQKIAMLAEENASLRKELAELKARPVTPGPQGPKGEPGRDADHVDPADVAEALKMDPSFLAEITGPQGPEGPQGEPGPPGHDGRDADPVRIDALEAGQLRLANGLAQVRLGREEQAFVEAAACVVIVGGNYDAMELSAPEVAKALGIKPEELATKGVAKLHAGGMSESEARAFLKLN